MQSTGFLPGFYPCRDLNVGDNGGAWNLYNSEKILNNVHSRNVFSPLPTKYQFSVYEKEVLRQTILQHESIFREQVRKLHRLHRRQRELMMDEIKRRMLFDQNIQSESTAFLPKISSQAAQGRCQIPSLSWVNPTASRFSISCTENFRSTSNFSELSCSKCEKPKKKMLDLELPAEEYSDSEEEKDQSGNEKVSKVSELPCYHPTKGMEEVLQKSDVELFRADLADLNEPLGLEDASASISMDLNMPPISLLDSEISQQNLKTEEVKMLDLSNKPNKEREDTIDLNCCIDEDEPSPKLSIPAFNKTVEEIDLEAPVSPENKECSPPRGDSEENSPETPAKLSKQEGDGDNKKNELVRMAAEAIVLMSTSRFSKLLLQNIVDERLEGCCNDSLDWFAEVVSSLAGDLGNEIGLVLGQEEETSGVLSRSKPRRGKQRKNFQTGSGTRNGGRNVRRLGTLICKDLENATCSPLERQNFDSSALRERSLKGWGKVNRRRRGPRIPSSNIPTVFG